MKKYRVQVPVEDVKGYQYFIVKAESREDAVRKIETGEDCELESEELEVYALAYDESSVRELEES